MSNLPKKMYNNKKGIPQAELLAGFFFCGVTEIRTRDTLLAYTRFPGVPLQPLEHHSFVFHCAKLML